MKIKKGDKVKVIKGKFKNTVGIVLSVFPKENKLIVEKVNIQRKHLKPSQTNPDGGVIEREAKIHISNVAFCYGKAGSEEITKIGYKIIDKKKIRFNKKLKKEI